jgi:hypothetical protein
MEELEAADWYDQRALVTENPELQAILIHNRDEEKEHAAMLLEWLRRHDEAFSDHLKAYLFRDGPIHERKTASSDPITDGALGIGSLRGEA